MTPLIERLEGAEEDFIRSLRWSSRDGYRPGERVLMVRAKVRDQVCDYSYAVDVEKLRLMLDPARHLSEVVLWMQDAIIARAIEASPDAEVGS